MLEKSTRSSLVSAPTNQPAPSLPSYGRDIPQALKDLSHLLLDIPAAAHEPEESSIPPAEEPTSITPVAAPEAQDPVQVPVVHPQQDAQSSDAPVVIAPSGYTRTGSQVRRPARFAYAAYHCSPSVTFIPSPASGHLHQPSHNPTVILMQCHSTWPCNNPTGTSLSPPWHVNWVNTPNSSTGG